MKLIDGKSIARDIQEDIKNKISRRTSRPPGLAVILVGDNPASTIYINRKRQACEEVGIRSILYRLPETASEEQILQQIHRFNQDPMIDGILIQLPLPPHINPHHITIEIDPAKDVDGFHPLNVGKLFNGEKDGLVPCTPLGIKIMLQKIGVETAGKHILIFGRSNIVGKPLAALFMQNAEGGNATVTLVHSHSKNVEALSRQADIVIAAMGKPKFIKESMIKVGAVVIDVGINKIINPALPKGYQLVGDVDFDNVNEKCSFITPVPGGVGPLTIAMLLQNTLTIYERKHGL